MFLPRNLLNRFKMCAFLRHLHNATNCVKVEPKILFVIPGQIFILDLPFFLLSMSFVSSLVGYIDKLNSQ
jgi:hypothetical protein